MNRTLVAILIVGLALVLMTAWLGRYEIVTGHHGLIYRLDRWTGSVSVSDYERWKTIADDEKPQGFTYLDDEKQPAPAVEAPTQGSR